MILALLATTLQGCGDGTTTTDRAAVPPPAGAQEVALPSSASRAATAPGRKAAAAAAAATRVARQAPPAAAFTPSARPGRAPAVLLVGPPAQAGAEAARLSSFGVASLAVGPSATPAQLDAAVSALRARPGVDPTRLGLVAEGPAAANAARFLVRAPAFRAAVFVAAGVAAERPLSEVRGPMVLLQRQQGAGGAAGSAVAQRLVTAAPPGTLMHELPSLGAAATRDRDLWLRGALRS